MSEEKIYQPGWGEKPKHRHHHDTRSGTRHKNFGGALRMRDKQAYIGLILVLVGGAVFGLYLLVHMFLKELRAMPKDDPSTEMAVDEPIRRRSKMHSCSEIVWRDTITWTH